MQFLILLFTVMTVSVPIYSAPQISKFVKDENGSQIDLLNPEIPQKINLKPILDIITAMLDTDGMVDFISNKLQSDPSAQATLAYLRGSSGKTINNYFWNQLEFVKIIYWLYNNGLSNIYNDINLLHVFLGWNSVYPPPSMNLVSSSSSVQLQHHHTKSLKSLLEEFIELYEYDFYRAGRYLVELLITGDESIVALFNQIKQPQMEKAWKMFKIFPEVQQMFEILRTEDINIDHLISIIEQFLGWGRMN